jgi:hypothetical protein
MKIKGFLFILLSLFCMLIAWTGKAVASANQATTASYPKSNLKPSAETKSGSSQKTKMMGALNCESVNKLFGNPPIKNREFLGLNRFFYTDKNHKLIDVYCDSKPYSKDKNLWVVALVRDINHTRSDKEGEGQVTYSINLAMISNPLQPKILVKTNPLLLTFKDGQFQFSLHRLDLGNYDLGKLGKALGLRVYLESPSHKISYCRDELLMLFVQKNNSLQLVFENQIGSLRDINGSGDTEEERGTLLMQKDSTLKSDIPNLIIKNGNDKQIFVWNSQAEKFERQQIPALISIHPTQDDPIFFSVLYGDYRVGSDKANIIKKSWEQGEST